MKGAVLFDRDGTLNADKGYTHKPDELVWLDGAREAVRLVNQRGLLAIVVTNQAGIARGYYDEAAMHLFHDRMQSELAAGGARIDAFYFCPFHADASIERYRHAAHPDRKPSPGMILRALRDHNVDAARALLVGDQQSDIDAGRAAGIATLRAGGQPLDRLLARALDQLAWIESS